MIRLICSACNSAIAIRYLQVGEVAKCPTCGAQNLVTDSPDHTGSKANNKAADNTVALKPSFTSRVDYSANLRQLPARKALRSLVTENVAKAASGSLVLWGVINVGSWLWLGAESREFLGGLSNPSGGIYFLMYGSLVLGSFMLLAGLLGSIIKHPTIVLTDGLALLAVGLWNVIHDFAAISALKPYGYTVDKPSTLWIMLGIAQLVWGSREISRYGEIDSTLTRFEHEEKEQATKRIKELVELPEAPDVGRLKGSITRTSFPFFQEQTTNFTAFLLPDRAMFIEQGIGSMFEIDRKEVAGKAFSEPRIEIHDTNHRYRRIDLEGKGLRSFSEWAAVKVNRHGRTGGANS